MCEWERWWRRHTCPCHEWACCCPGTDRHLQRHIESVRFVGKSWAMPLAPNLGDNLDQHTAAHNSRCAASSSHRCNEFLLFCMHGRQLAPMLRSVGRCDVLSVVTAGVHLTAGSVKECVPHVALSTPACRPGLSRLRWPLHRLTSTAACHTRPVKKGALIREAAFSSADNIRDGEHARQTS